MSQSASKYFIVSVCLNMKYYLITDKSTIKLYDIAVFVAEKALIDLKNKKAIHVRFFYIFILLYLMINE